MALIFQVERFSDVIEEAQPLLQRHWVEIADYKDCIPLSPNYARYALLEGAGRLLVFTARRDGALVGYASFIIDTGLHYSTVRFAESDILWVAPEERRVGAAVAKGIIGLFEKTLGDIGVSVIRISSKVSHPALSRLLKSRGYVLTEMLSAKLLQRPE